LAVSVEGVGKHPFVGCVDVEDGDTGALEREPESVIGAELASEALANLRAYFQVAFDGGPLVANREGRDAVRGVDRLPLREHAHFSASRMKLARLWRGAYL